MGRLIVRAQKMAAGGDAIARRDDGKVVFVAGALPGETVSVDIVNERKDFAKAVVFEVLDPSPDRVAAPCPALARGCGGCSWQHVEPAAQLRLKAAIAADALVRIAKLDDPVVSTGGAVPPFAYRTTIRVAAAADGRGGLRAASSHDVIPLDDCLVAHPAIAGLLPALRLSTGSEGVLRVGVSSGERSAMAVDGTISGLPDDVAVGPDAVVHETVGGVVLRVSAASFFQSGPAAAELLVGTVRRAGGAALGEPGVIDLYGGVGLFSAALRLPAPVVVESSPSACADAVANLGVDAVVEHTAVEQWHPRPAPAVIADPARTGLGAAGVGVVAATGAPLVVLVSCDAAALGRDARLMAGAGYTLTGSTVLDLFPNTAHLEVVSTFTR